ncbi:MAG: hypothetical protein JRI68_23610 [Deltaproteobacteria bacterium]|nr:hypothetical protein [Deltaproteobacteria bacterium]
MRALGACCAAAALTVASLTQAAPPRSLPNGWALHKRDAVSSDSTVGCGVAKAVLRRWADRFEVFDGSSFSKLPELPGKRSGTAYGVHVAMTPSGSDIYADAGGRVAHWDGDDWSLLSMPGWRGPVNSIAVLKSGQLVVVGRGRVGLRQGSKIVSYDAGTWRDLSAVTGTSLADLWIAGQGGTVMRHQQTGWSRLNTGFDRWVRGLHVGSPSAIWAWGSRDPWGNATYVMRLHGGSWSPASDGLSDKVAGMAGPADRPWAATDSVIARFDGTRWVAELRGSDLGPDYQRFGGLCTTAQYLFAASKGRASGVVVRKLGR